MEQKITEIEDVSTELYTLYHYLRFTCGLDEEHIHVLRTAGQLIYRYSEAIAEDMPDLDKLTWKN